MPLRGLRGETDLMTSQGEIALDLLPRMERDQVLEEESVFGFSYLSWTDTKRLFVCLWGFLDPTVCFLLA